MPADFEKCVKNGGKVVTKNIGKDRYMHICYDKNGDSHAGEVLTRKKEKSNEKIVMEARVTLNDLMKLKEHFNSNHHTD